ncbi:MAG: DUF1302 family protein [Amphritea sp.]
MSKTIITTMNKLAAGVAMGVTGLSMGYVATAAAAEADVSGFVENATYYRDSRGISKFRNTGQLEVIKPVETEGRWYNVTVNGVLRGTYDGVYDLNDDEFGASSDPEAYLGEHWHPNDNPPVAFAPVKFPCENGDAALCSNLDDYMDKDEDEVEFPEFNEELDFIRELYVDATTDISNGDQFSIRLGKQQVVWGKTDLFRVLDVINPVDFSRHNIYDELEDSRIPQWILQAEWRMGATGTLDDSNLSLVWNFDKFRPNNLGQCGTAYVMLDAGCFFSARIPAFGGLPVISGVDIPNWQLSNTQGGIKWEGVAGDATFSLNAYTYRQQLPSLHANADPGAAGGVFEIQFPRVNLIGGSIDYYSQDIDSVLRLETTYTEGEEVPALVGGFAETDMFRYVLGLDKNVVIPALSSSAFLFSGQLFGEHILDYRDDLPNEEDNWIGTLLVKGWWMNNRLSPQVIIAHDVGAQATAFVPSVDYLVTDNWKVNLALNVKSGGNEKFDTAPAPFGVWEPLARFSNGPIGVANEEDELQLTIRYSF